MASRGRRLSGGRMATYVTLVNLTDQDVRNVKDSRKRLSVQRDGEKRRVVVKHVY